MIQLQIENDERQITAAQFEKIQNAGVPLIKHTGSNWQVWGEVDEAKIDEIIGPSPDRIYNRTEFAGKLAVCSRHFAKLLDRGDIPPGKFMSQNGKSFWDRAQVEATLGRIGRGKKRR